MKFEFNPSNLHHAYLIVGDVVVSQAELLRYIADDLEYSIRGNPDFWQETYQTFGIDDARALSEMHLRKPLAEKKLFVLTIGSIMLEAQNALLKLFEEPQPGNHFFLIMQSDASVIPTLRSRMQKVEVAQKEKNTDFGKKFLSSNIVTRLNMMEQVIEDKNKDEARAYIHSLIDAIRSEYSDEKEITRTLPVLETLMKSDDYLSDRSPSVKILLEHIAHIV